MRAVEASTSFPGVFIYVDDYIGYYIRERDGGIIDVDEMHYYTLLGRSEPQWWIKGDGMGIRHLSSWPDWIKQALEDPHAFLAYLLVL